MYLQIIVCALRLTAQSYYGIWKWHQWGRAAHCLLPCRPRSNRLTSHRSNVFLLFQLTRSPCIMSSACKLPVCALCGTTEQEGNTRVRGHGGAHVSFRYSAAWAPPGREQDYRLPRLWGAAKTSGVNGDGWRDEARRAIDSPRGERPTETKPCYSQFGSI